MIKLCQNMNCSLQMSQDIVVSLVIRLQAVQFLAVARDFPVLQNVQTSCGAHPAFCSIVTTDYFPGGKVVGVWIWPCTFI
jgi:hypothetical protein